MICNTVLNSTFYCNFAYALQHRYDNFILSQREEGGKMKNNGCK